MSPAPRAPLESQAPRRAEDLKAKVRERISDVRRHLTALRSAMAHFGENFNEAAFTSAYASSDPDELNHVKAVERGVDQLYNYMAELSAFGLELAGVRVRDADTNARLDFNDLQRIGVLSRERTARLQRLRELRRLLTHEYATASAAQIHEAAWIVADDFPIFYKAYAEWIRRGFAVPGGDT
jgi:uncharacterized protein YutE (UPF0331/DUF86 family)